MNNAVQDANVLTCKKKKSYASVYISLGALMNWITKPMA